MQVDDDSSTDIDRSYELLNDFYDYVDPMMFLCSEPQIWTIVATYT